MKVQVLAVVVLLVCVSGALGDGYLCSQWRHTKDKSSYAQTCAVYGLPKTLPYWELVGTWNVWSDCRACGSPFHNFTEAGPKLAVPRGDLATESLNPNEDKVAGDEDMCPCCIYGEAPYYDGPDFLAEEINPKSGDMCESKRYQFTLMGQWKTSNFYAPLSWCFWQTYTVTW